jgi:hypothetical protein
LPTAGALGLERCPGDCDGNGAVTVNELVVAVGVALTGRSAADCPGLDASGDAAVQIDDLVIAVNMARRGCAGVPTATPTVTPGPPPTVAAHWTEAFDASAIGWMMSGWGPGDGTVWVVGGTLDEGRILRRDAGEWTEVDPGIPVPLLNWVHGTSATDVFVAGDFGRILHFDGQTWRRHATPIAAAVWGLWAVAPDDVWAVGGDTIPDSPPFIMHYDGQAWSLVPVTLQRPRVSAFFKVWGSGPDDLYVVGQNGVALHYDGHTFTELFLGVSQDLIGIWGTGPNDIVLVGGRGTAEVVHYDGVRWTRRTPDRWPGLNGVWMRRADVAHAVGVDGTVLRVDPRTLEVTPEIDVPTTLSLHAVFGDESSGQLLTLGGNFVTPEQGVALVRRLGDED